MHTSRSLAALVALAALAACGDDAKKPGGATGAKSTTAPGTKPAAPAKPAPTPVEQAKQAAAATQGQLDQTQKDATAVLAEIDLPTQEAADAQAAQAITEANADAEFAKLQKELEEDQP